MALANLGQHVEAERSGRSATETLRLLADRFPEVPGYRQRYATSLAHLAQVLHRRGSDDQAAEAMGKSMQILGDLLAEFPDVPGYRSVIAHVQQRAGEIYREMGRIPESDDAFRRAAQLWGGIVEEGASPADLEAYAWFLAACPSLEHRDPQEARKLAENALLQAPQNPRYRGTLAAAHYRAGDWESVLSVVPGDLMQPSDGDARAWFFRAMAHAKLDNREAAAQDYQAGCSWMQENCPDHPDLKRIREETAATLELPVPLDPPPSSAEVPAKGSGL
jgi:tetratricopeptide (TPR) repeat protein